MAYLFKLFILYVAAWHAGRAEDVTNAYTDLFGNLAGILRKQDRRV
jgi:hypothetical protein